MELKLWTLTLLVALLNLQLPLYQDWLKGHGTLEPEECDHTNNFFTTSHSPIGASENAYCSGIQEPHSHELSLYMSAFQRDSFQVFEAMLHDSRRLISQGDRENIYNCQFQK